jgi:hypothetical protein
MSFFCLSNLWIALPTIPLCPARNIFFITNP